MSRMVLAPGQLLAMLSMGGFSLHIGSLTDLERLAATYGTVSAGGMGSWASGPAAQARPGVPLGCGSSGGCGSEGVQAAKRAAEAATAGRNRMLRMWERMQRMMSQSPDAVPRPVCKEVWRGPSTGHASVHVDASKEMRCLSLPELLLLLCHVQNTLWEELSWQA